MYYKAKYYLTESCLQVLLKLMIQFLFNLEWASMKFESIFRCINEWLEYDVVKAIFQHEEHF